MRFRSMSRASQDFNTRMCRVKLSTRPKLEKTPILVRSSIRASPEQLPRAFADRRVRVIDQDREPLRPEVGSLDRPCFDRLNQHESPVAVSQEGLQCETAIFRVVVGKPRDDR